ncbi:MarR family winged helix-turn-helix transcriptional regulator [Knoellia sp. p5-6-4]|jgi:DNA-binding MarR family transcriptional regulator|uniref:MarR family winged helix-turn-helix transcriptional regulator n=1 Tax=unclassified Knoellia TaxID=2618719 RepID=UPI0023DB8C04|nr:MarR family transcriptional regulator [Knoellia sp. p5-6-4]MDF2145558.1 MarR family transcriptional regulator [Knoellia sp. p5-6-4]
MTSSDRRAVSAGLSPSAVAAVAGEIRLACMRISRRIRFESTHEVPPHQFSVLARLQEAPRTPGELAEIERVSAPSMTRTVAALVERGLVARTADPSDGRQVILSLTDEAKRVLKEIRRRRDQWMTVRVKALSPEDQEVLRKAAAILTRVASE